MKALALILGLLAGAVSAQTLEMPANATLSLETVTEPGSLGVAIGPWDGETVPLLTGEGRVVRQAWRVESGGLTTLQILAPLRDQLEAAGWEILLECRDRVCGGYDFRANISVLSAPEMHVNFADYRYLSARDPDTGGLISILVSRTSRVGFVQVMQVGPAPAEVRRGTEAILGTGPSPGAEVRSETIDLATALDATGSYVLSDLTFATGSADLGPGPYESLAALAQWLAENPDLKIALVGHTDSQGSLEANIALSKRRAASVMERLAEAYGVPREQMEAEGMGYLSPVASNRTEAGREANRRVEVIVTSTE